MWPRGMIVDGEISVTVMFGPAVYRVRVEGNLPLNWSESLMGMNITTSGSDDSQFSTLVGRLPDQAALAGVLATLYEKQYPILSVECLERG